MLALSIAFLLAGCATVQDFGGHRVLVRVTSDPPGAPILVQGTQEGRTPAYVEVRRASSNSISLLTADGPKDVQIDSKYRWSTSFFGNLVFLTYAPIGWIVDLISGAAWDPEDPPTVLVRLTPEEIQAAKAEDRGRMAVIAPPQAATLPVSDAAGEALEEYLKREQVPIESFRSTLPSFISNGYDFDGRPDEQKLRSIYRLIGATHVYESTVDQMGDQWRVRATPVEVRSGINGEPVEVTFKADNSYFETLASLGWWSRVFPNAIGFEFANEYLAFTERDTHGNEKTYDFSAVDGTTFWDNVAQILSSVSLSNIPPRREGSSGRWRLQFVPSFYFSRKKFRLSGEDLDPSIRVVYQRTLLGGGYGPEVGWQKSRHYIYLNLIPVFTWTEIKWPSGPGERSETATTLTYQSELGYSFQFTDEWSISVFSTTITENESLWRKVLPSQVQDAQVLRSGMNLSIVGLSVAYRWEPPLTWRR